MVKENISKLNIISMRGFFKYAKFIVSKMDFCPILLNKEYRKCLSYLSHSEKKKLNRWVKTKQFAKEINMYSRFDLNGQN